MTLLIDLPPELERKLQQCATAAGKDPATFARDTLEEKLREPEIGAPIRGQAAENGAIRGVEEFEEMSLEALVEKIKATPPNPAAFRPATGNLAEALRTGPEDPDFDWEMWNKQWSAIEAEMKARDRANDIAEGLGG